MTLVVHSMGHCGTRSIVKTLRQAGHETLFGHVVTNPQRFDELEIYEIAKSNKNVYIICPIREPAHRNLSAFYGNPRMFPEQTIDAFINLYPHEIALDWFDDEFECAWGLNVYSFMFDKKRGWKVYNGNTLIIRLDVLNDAWSEAFNALTGLDAPCLIKSGVREAPDYLALKDLIPDDYVARMQASRYYRHFFNNL